MNRSSKELKRLSRQTLIGKYGLVVLACFLVQLIVGMVMGPFDAQTNDYIQQATLSQDPGAFPIFSVIASIIIALVSTVLSAGLVKLHLDLSRGQSPSIAVIFSQFKHRPDRFIIVTILLGLIGVVCVLPGSILTIVAASYSAIVKGDYGLPLVIAGIILIVIGTILTVFFSLRFSLSLIMLVDDPSIGAIASLKNSFRMMKGHCGRLLYISFSFIPMILLVILSFGIASFWITPYIQNVLIWFYLDVTGEIDRKIEETRRLEEEMGPILSE